MKRIIAITTLVTMLFINASFTYAGIEETFTISITINHNKSITLTETTLRFDDITLGEAVVSTNSIGVTNNGTGIDESITVSVNVTEGWKLYIKFSDTQPLVSDGDWVAVGQTDAVLGPVAFNETKRLWGKIVPPSTYPDEALTMSATANVQ